MYTQLAVKTTDKFITKQIIPAEDREVYEYSFEVLYSDFAYAAIAVVTALLLQCGLATLVFLAGFLPLRRLAGGYHASTYKRCHLLFWLNQVAMALCFHLVPDAYYKISVYSMLVFGLVCILAFAPVEHANKPLSLKERKRFFLLSRVLVVAIILAVLLLDRLNASFKYIFVYAFGVYSSAFSLLAEKIGQITKKGVVKHE